MAKSIGGWPGFSITVRPITVAGASAREMSSITASKVRPVGSAIRVSIIARPVRVSAIAGPPIMIAMAPNHSAMTWRIRVGNRAAALTE